MTFSSAKLFLHAVRLSDGNGSSPPSLAYYWGSFPSGDLFLRPVSAVREGVFPLAWVSVTGHGSYSRAEFATNARWMDAIGRENGIKCQIYGQKVQNPWELETLDVITQKMLLPMWLTFSELGQI